MKIHKIILLVGLISGLTISTQASVYGTLKQELCFKDKNNESIVKEAGQGVSILDEDENNFLVFLKEGHEQYISKKFVNLAGTLTRVKFDGVDLKEEPTDSASSLKQIDKEALVVVLDEQDDCYKVKIDGIVGYVSKDAVYNQGKDSLVVSEESENGLGDQIVDYAKQFVGGRYVYGGNDLNTGVDCSGFTSQVMKHFGISIARSSRAQYQSSGYAVSESNIKPGDLVFYGSDGSNVDHVALYIGGNQIIHANTTSTGIKISSLHYGKPLIGIKRVI